MSVPSPRAVREVRPRRRLLSRRSVAAVCLLLSCALVGCSVFRADLQPKLLEPVERGEYDGPAPVIVGAREPVAADTVYRLARVFYIRVTDRRFNSLSTFYDPALREYFHTPESFADYFAALADALSWSHFEALRPNHVTIDRLDVLSPNLILVTHRYEGENSLPLRFWSVQLEQVDRWEQTPDGRWYIIPGKL